MDSSRFKDAQWYDAHNKMDMIVGGAGGIGSWLTLLLSRLGDHNTIVLYDFDTVEAHNRGGQLFKRTDINKYKVEAIDRTVMEFSDLRIHAIADKYTETSMVSKYMFAGFDNMAARKVMFERWVSIYGNEEDAIFIDGSVTLEQLQIRCVTKATVEKYRTTRINLTDEEVDDTPCTLKQTSHTAAMVASLMVAFFTNHLANMKTGKPFRKVPYLYEFMIPIAYTNMPI